MGLLNGLNSIFKRFGYELTPAGLLAETDFVRRIPYAEEAEIQIMESAKPYTQTTKESLFALIRAVKYAKKHGINGAFVECGVWKGGSVMAMAMTLDAMGSAEDIYLFDTFEGMPQSGKEDIDLDGNGEKWYREESDKYVHAGIGDGWNAVTLEDVKRNIGKVPATKQRFHYIKGKVEDTVPSQAPSKIALLRLDTDFYASTKHELEQLFPRLVAGGILIVDDYGHFLGSRKAVDEYFAKHNIRIFVHRIDYTAIIGVKQ